MKSAARTLLWLVLLAGIAVVAVPQLAQRGREPAAAPAPSDAPRATPIAAGPESRTSELLEAMATLVGAMPERDVIASWERKLEAGASIDGYIDEILASKRFGSEVIPALVLGMFVNVRNYYALPSGFVLKRSADAVLYLREPCARADAVTVHPWWDLASEVQVCPDSYRPSKWTLAPGEHAYRSQMALTCDSQVGSPELESASLCGCGPNLIRCVRDGAHYDELNHSLMNEVKQTTAYIVDHDLPMATLFTGNQTFRDRNAELYYRRQKIGALELKRATKELEDLAEWPATGQWAPRAELRPGQHAGVLTAPRILHWLPDRRQRQRGYYEMMWCSMKNSFGATTQQVLDLNSTGNLAFVHDSWQRLAKTELCTNCHARLDYGFQFFLGYPDSRASTHFNPALQAKGKGPLYGRDIDDPRGEAPLTPLGFAKLATSQPEFKSCMASHFVNYVLGARATEEDRRAIEQAVEATEKFKPVMKVALERYAARWRAEHDAAGSPPSAQPPASPVPANASTIPIGGPLRTQLDKLCIDCHDRTPDRKPADSGLVPSDFTAAQLPRSLVVSMTDRVAFGMMPKDQPLDAGTRDALVSTLIDTLWPDPQARAEARRYYLGRARGLPAHQIDNVIHAIDHVAHARSGITWGALERGIWSDQSTTTPGYLALVGLEALKACTQAQKLEGGKLEECLARATALPLISRWPPTHAP